MHEPFCKNEFYLHENEKSFSDPEGCALDLALMQRPEGTLGNGLFRNVPIPIVFVA